MGGDESNRPRSIDASDERPASHGRLADLLVEHLQRSNVLGWCRRSDGDFDSPNLAPLAALPFGYALLGPDRGAAVVRHGVGFVIPVCIAAVGIGCLHWIQFGDPLRSGYGTAAELYVLANIAPNAALYTHWLVASHGPWLLVAPLAIIVRRREILWLLAFAALAIVSYLVYAVFESWTYLRFMLPALTVAIIATATLIAGVLRHMPTAVRLVLTAAVVLAITTTNIASARAHGVFRVAGLHARGRVVGERLAATLPVNAVIISGEQSGTMRYYTDRAIVRWDFVAADAMPEVLERLALNGYQVWVVLDDWEEEAFRKKFPALAALSIDYEPALESAAGVGIRTRAWRMRRLVARSSNNEYATGTTTSVRNNDNVWPPMTTTAMVRRSSAPGPVPSANGSIPPTSAKVVMRMGRNRSRLASRIATPRSWPCRRKLSV